MRELQGVGPVEVIVSYDVSHGIQMDQSTSEQAFYSGFYYMCEISSQLSNNMV